VERPPRPLSSRFWAAGLSFAPAAWLLEVPYCPHLPHLFFGEEMYQLGRMWTRGWEVFAPSTPIGFHQWERSARPSSYQASIQVGSAPMSAMIIHVGWAVRQHVSLVCWYEGHHQQRLHRHSTVMTWAQGRM
jgi:hypothetical protein